MMRENVIRMFSISECSGNLLIANCTVGADSCPPLRKTMMNVVRIELTEVKA
jgi:hypothetical protein